MSRFSREQLAGMIDHTILKPDATAEQVIQICREAEQYKFRSVCVNPSNVNLAKSNLQTVDVCSVIGFPLGANTTEIKVSEAKQAVADGAVEIDMVMNVGKLKAGDFDYVLEDIQKVADACHQENAILKVIIETCLLSEKEKIKACAISQKAGADFVKTSTGFSSGGATVEDIALMRKTVGPNMGVKASGGVRDTETAIAMIEAGATRIGASSSISIIEGIE